MEKEGNYLARNEEGEDITEQLDDEVEKMEEI